MREPSTVSHPPPAENAHLVQFYDGDRHLADAVTRFLGAGLEGSDQLLIIATAAHWKVFRQQLEAGGFDVAEGLRSGRIALLDAHETLAKFMRAGAPDPLLFEAEVGRAIAKTIESLSSPARLRAFGEMVDVLWQEGHLDAALRLEDLWNELQRRHSFTLLCAYAMANFYKEPSGLDRVCQTHSHVMGERTSPEAAAPELLLTLAQESAHRREVEQALRESLRDLRRKEQALRESQQQLSLITNTLPALVSWVDAGRRYRFVNEAYLRWFGIAPQEIVGKHLQDVLGPEAYEAIKPRVDQALSGIPASFEAEVPYRSGGPRWVEATYTPQRSSTGEVTGYIGLVADISERKKLEDFRTLAEERARRLLMITSAIADAVTDAQVYEAIVDHVASALEASSVALWLTDEQGTTATLARCVGYAEPARQRLASIPLQTGVSMPILESLRSKQPVWISSQAELFERYPHLREIATIGRSYRVACLPILAQGGLLGGLAVTFEAEGPEARTDEREFLQMISRYASQAIERLRLLERERRSRAAADAASARLNLLSQASRAFVETSLDLQSRLDGVASTFGTMVSSAVGISLLDAEGRLATSAIYHPDPEARALLEELARVHRVRMGEGVTGATIASGKSTHLPSIEPAEAIKVAAAPYRAFLERYPVYAMICVPLRAGGRLIGVVLTARVRKGETYKKDDLDLIEQLAERSAAAIDNSRLYEETLQARTRSDQLSRFAQAVMNADSVDRVLDAALDAIEAALGTQRSAVLTFGGEALMRFRAWRNLSDEYRGAVEGHSPWPADAISPAPVLVPDALATPSLASYAPLFAREGIGALAFFPLVSTGRLIGKFMVYFERPRALSQHELELVQAISNHLASVITRYEAFSRLEDTVRANELFAGVLAHDLRNPLGAMINAAQLIELRRQGQSDDDRERKPLKRILSSGQRMTTMIEQLLDFTRSRSGGGIEVLPTEVKLAELCAEAVSEFEQSHPESKVHVELLGELHGSWDADRLLQVFSNLLANASQHGAPEQGIRLRLDGTAADQIRVDIHNGGAIPRSLMPALFDPFRSAAHGRERARGLGLGLFIIREIARAHGGSVEVDSSEEAGTTFTLRLPRHAARRTKIRAGV